MGSENGQVYADDLLVFLHGWSCGGGPGGGGIGVGLGGHGEGLLHLVVAQPLQTHGAVADCVMPHWSDPSSSRMYPASPHDAPHELRTVQYGVPASIPHPITVGACSSAR
jgi:hypothetical protein